MTALAPEPPDETLRSIVDRCWEDDDYKRWRCYQVGYDAFYAGFREAMHLSHHAYHKGLTRLTASVGEEVWVVSGNAKRFLCGGEPAYCAFIAGFERAMFHTHHAFRTLDQETN